MEKIYKGYLDKKYGVVKIMDCNYRTSEVLLEISPIVYWKGLEILKAVLEEKLANEPWEDN